MGIAKEEPKPPQRHKFSVEYLYHFQCYNCKQWWSIGDWEGDTLLCCPKCECKAFTERMLNE